MTPEHPTFYVVQPHPFARLWGELRQTCISAYEDNCLGIAKGAAYSALLAFFPVLGTIAAILVRANAEAVSRALSRFLFEVVPPGTEDLVQYQFTVRGERPISLLVIASLLSLWAASGAMISLMEGFQAAYRLPSGRPFLKQRLIAILLVFTLALPAVGASALVIFGERFQRSILPGFGGTPDVEEMRTWVAIIGSVLRYAVAFGTVVLVTGLLYYFGPNCRKRFRGVWPGAFLSTLLWLGATAGFGWYVQNVARYNVMYGSIGTVIALLAWMYMMAIIALFGCEFNAERERLRRNP
jgi:membrane protein